MSSAESPRLPAGEAGVARRPITGGGWSGAFARHRRGLAPRLLGLILLFSSAVTLLAAGLQLYFDYRRDVDAIETRLDQIEDSYLDGLAGSLWNLDIAQLRLQLEGMRHLPDMQALRVEEVAPDVVMPLVVAVGDHRDSAVVFRDIPIRRPDGANRQAIGTLHVEMTLEGVYHRLADAAIVILVSQGIKTFLVSAFILVVVHQLVTRHLFAIADHVDEYDPRRPSPPLRLNRLPPKSGDELERVVVAINRTSAGLRQAYAELRDVNAQLRRDISVRRSQEERLVRQANYDELTGLPNRLLLLDRLDHAIVVANRQRSVTALLCIDLDHFKTVNDRVGHAAGDALLIEAARRLATCVRQVDTLARMGGDEFIIVLPGVASDRAAQKVAARVVEAFSRPFLIGGAEFLVTTSVGITLYPADGTIGQELLRNADLAMYKAKDRGRNGYRFFTPEINRRVRERLAIETRLRAAAASGEFVLHYQPVIDLASGRPRAVEALLRWRQPDGTIAPPGVFLPIAEEAGLIGDIGEWVVATACVELRQLVSAGGPLERIAVNISPRQLRLAGFAGFVERALAESEVTPDRLELEVTESVMLDGGGETEANLSRLAAMGVRLSIDDFGTGYSSLALLQRFPVDTLKIDRTIIAAAGPRSARLAESIITMAHGLGMVVIAEGVETEAQWRFLTERRCDFAQGFLFVRPLPLAALLDRLDDWPAPGAAQSRGRLGCGNSGGGLV